MPRGERCIFLVVHHFDRYDAPMPTLNPRITVTLTPEGHAALRRLSLAGGGSQSFIVAELLQMAAPTLDRVATLLELAARAQVSSREALRADLVASQAVMEEHLGAVTGELDRLMGSRAWVPAPAGATAAPAAGTPSGAVPTPFSNRGVTPPPPPPPPPPQRRRQPSAKAQGGKP